MIIENLKYITEEQMIHVANMFEKGDWVRVYPTEKWDGHDLIMSKNGRDYVFRIDYSCDFKMMSYTGFNRFRLYENLTV